MVTPKETLEKIREIIEKHYSNLSISVLGKSVFSFKELRDLQEAGVDVSNKNSLLSMIYFHNFINTPVDGSSPKTFEQMKAQQETTGIKPEGQAVDYTIENINDKTKQYVDKLKMEVMTRLEGIIRENNDSYKLNALRNLDRESYADELVKESTLGSLKSKLMDTAGDANRDWLRVALTEMSNAIGIGSVDRIVSDNIGSNQDAVYVYRVTVKDSKTCKWCRKFYNDSDFSPKLYRLSTLLANGSNYGKKYADWVPVCGATHPNTRTSQIVELKPGFKLLPSGNVTYMGLDGWTEYINQKLIN